VCRIAKASHLDWDVDDGEEGVVMVRGPGVFPGYYHNDEDTREMFHNGWLNTGAADDVSSSR
jgi:long-chain acyl-CoA synthetase